MIHGVYFSNSNHTQSKNISFSGVHVFEIPKYYRIETAHDLDKYIIKNQGGDAYKVIEKFKNFVKSIIPEQDEKTAKTVSHFFNVDGKGMFACLTGEDASKVRSKEDFPDMVSLVKGYIEFENKSKEFIKEKSIEYTLKRESGNPDNINFIKLK